MTQAAVVDQLREKIRKLEAQPRQLVMALRTGLSELDEWGTFRLGTGVELCGEDASGKATVALSVVAAAGREKRLSAWVDGPHELYPPAAMALGVELSSLLIVRPKTPPHLVWAAMQLLRSGAFTCVVLDVSRTPVRLSMIDTKKLLDAARIGGSLLVLLTSGQAPAVGFPRLKFKPRLEGRLQVARVSERWCTSTFEVDAPHGRRAVVQGTPVRSRALARPWPSPDVLQVLDTSSLQRPKKNTLRDGYPVGWAQPRNMMRGRAR
jgi:recombination protein RecA